MINTNKDLLIRITNKKQNRVLYSFNNYNGNYTEYRLLYAVEKQGKDDYVTGVTENMELYIMSKKDWSCDLNRTGLTRKQFETKFKDLGDYSQIMGHVLDGLIKFKKPYKLSQKVRGRRYCTDEEKKELSKLTVESMIGDDNVQVTPPNLTYERYYAKFMELDLLGAFFELY